MTKKKALALDFAANYCVPRSATFYCKPLFRCSSLKRTSDAPENEYVCSLLVNWPFGALLLCGREIRKPDVTSLTSGQI